jgi:catechol 2,3-dioxygenase-like lactoylglutathione lyase family enzyme
MSEPNLIPSGGVTPYLTIPARGGQAAVEFYRAAFGAEELFRNLAEDGERLMHSRLVINGGLLMLSDEFPEYGNETGPVCGRRAGHASGRPVLGRPLWPGDGSVRPLLVDRRADPARRRLRQVRSSGLSRR